MGGVNFINGFVGVFNSNGLGEITAIFLLVFGTAALLLLLGKVLADHTGLE